VKVYPAIKCHAIFDDALILKVREPKVFDIHRPYSKLLNMVPKYKHQF
jgi:hypothetical protein